MGKMKILYAEDERQLSMAVSEILKLENYEVDAVYDGQAAWERLQSNYYDAVILDVMMPRMDGITVLSRMRENEIFTPVLMLTAKATTEDRVDGLFMGADDYLGKPFAMKELIARLNSMIRRSAKYRHSVLRCGNIQLNCDTDELKSDNSSLMLSNKESELLALLIRQQNRALSTQKLNEILWDGAQAEQTVTLYISYLKNKLSQIKANVVVNKDENGYMLQVSGA